MTHPEQPTNSALHPNPIGVASSLDESSPDEALIDDQLIDDATAEFFRLVADGQQPNIADFAKRYPKIERLLTGVLPALAVLRNAAKSELSDSRSAIDVASVVQRDHTQPNAEPPELSDFDLIRQIGRGGMGVVYEANQRSLSRTVAVKLLPTVATIDPNRIRRFRNESMAVAALDHPNIVDLYGIGCEQNVHFYAMRLIDGMSLTQIISQLKVLSGNEDADEPAADSASDAVLALSDRDARRYRNVAGMMSQLAEALHHAHQQGIIHRDVKPDNILVDNQGKPWVTDFGLAQIATEDSLTQTGDLLGTLRYMAPEQLDGNRAIDHRIDVYALGATFYELLTMRSVIAGDDRATILGNLRRLNSIPVSAHNPDVPRELETMIMKAIAPHPGDRYSSASDLAGDLQAWLDGKPISVRPRSLIGDGVRWCRRNPLVASLLGLLIGLSLVVAIVSTASYQQIANQNEQLSLANAEQTRQRIEAEQRFTVALESIGTFHSGVSKEMMLKQPALRDLRLNLLRQARTSYDRLARRVGDSTPVAAKFALAKAYSDLADLIADTSSGDDAIQTHERTMHVLNQVLADDPKHSKARKLLGDVQNDSGFHHMTAGRRPRAIELYTTAIENYLQLDLPPLSAVCNSYTNLANLHSQSGDWQAAVEHYEAALAFVHRSPIDSRGARESLSMILGDYANHHSSRGNISKSIELTGRAIELDEQLVAEFPNDRHYASSLANAYGNLANQCYYMDDLDQAISYYEKSIVILEEQVAQRPSDLSTRTKLARSLGNFGSILYHAKQLPKSTAVLQRSLAELERLQAEDPDNLDWQLFESSYRKTLGDVHESLGQFEDAITCFEVSLAISRRRHPKIPSFESITNAQISLANVRLRIGDYDTAQDIIASAKRERNLTDASSLSGIHALQMTATLQLVEGDVQRSLGNVPAAAAIYQATLAMLDPEEPMHRGVVVWCHLRLAQMQLDTPTHAKAALDRMNIDTATSRLNTDWLMAHAMLGHADEVFDHLDKNEPGGLFPDDLSAVIAALSQLTQSSPLTDRALAAARRYEQPLRRTPYGTNPNAWRHVQASIPWPELWKEEGTELSPGPGNHSPDDSPPT